MFSFLNSKYQVHFFKVVCEVRIPKWYTILKDWYTMDMKSMHSAVTNLGSFFGTFSRIDPLTSSLVGPSKGERPTKSLDGLVVADAN